MKYYHFRPPGPSCCYKSNEIVTFLTPERSIFAYVPGGPSQVTSCQEATVYTMGSLQTTCLVRVSHQHMLQDMHRSPALRRHIPESDSVRPPRQAILCGSYADLMRILCGNCHVQDRAPRAAQGHTQAAHISTCLMKYGHVCPRAVHIGTRTVKY